MTNPAGVAPPATSPNLPTRALRATALGAIFLAALGGTSAMIRGYLPFPEVAIVTDKLEHLALHGDEYDALFIGSSRVQFQIAPAIFDSTAAEKGIAVKSFNAGVWAMTPPEDGYFIDQILRRPHQRLRWVFIECMEVAPQGLSSFAGTSRSIYWHDWERTSLMETRCLENCGIMLKRPHLSWWDRAQVYGLTFSQSLDNLVLFVENFINFGRGEDLLNRWANISARKNGRRHVKNPSNGGWMYPKENQRMDARVTELYERDYARLTQEGAQRFYDSADPASDEAMRRTVEKFTKCGVTPILITSATVAAKRFLPSPALARSLAIFDFSDPHEYPELFAHENRLDGVHLNIAGSEKFTRLLALRFVDYLGAH